jgi:hypothetical protein
VNRKQFILVLLALALIGGAGLVLLRRNQQSWSVREAKAGAAVLPSFRFNDVAAIHIKGSSEFNLVHKNGLWSIPERADYPANYNQIKELLIKVRDLKVVQAETIGPSQLSRVQLEAPGNASGSGLLLEFKDAQGNGLGALLLGKKHDRQQNDNEPLGIHGFFDGRYLLLPSDPHNVLLVADELVGAASEPGEWLNPEFFKVENIRFISLLSPKAGNSWELSRETASSPWVLVGLTQDEKLNPTMASDVAEILAFPHFVDVASNAAPAAAALVNPTVVTVLTEHLAYTLKVGAKRLDGNYPMTVSVAADLPAQRVAAKDETPEDRTKLDQQFQDDKKQLLEKVAHAQALKPWIYLVDSWMDMVVRDRAQLLQQKASAGEQSAR